MGIGPNPQSPIPISQIYPSYEKLDTTRLVNFYNILFSDKKNNKTYNLLFKNLKYSHHSKFLDLFKSRETEIDSKNTYLLLLTHHFKNDLIDSTEQQFKEFLNSKILENINLFTPEEINNILTILINNKHLSIDNSIEIKKGFINLIKSETEKMSLDENILYKQTILIIIDDILKNENKENLNEYKDILYFFQKEIMKKVSQFGIFQTASLLELIHHFKSALNLNEYFSLIDLDKLTENLLKKISLRTNKDLVSLFEDYYLVFLFLYDLNYKNMRFWDEYSKYIQLYQNDEEFKNLLNENDYYNRKFQKLKILNSLINNQTLIQ